nr:RNA-directed DNA polymerase, eukaryota [Tanacetum cinerariifolium]
RGVTTKLITLEVYVNYNADEGTIEGDGVSVNVNSKGDDVDSRSLVKNGIDLTIIVVYAPHDLRDKVMLWEYLGHVVNQWHGEIKDNRCNRKVAFDKLKEELHLVDEAIDKGVGTKEVVNKKVEVLNSLRYIDRMHAMDLSQKAKIKWSIEGDENSSFFHRMLNKKRNQSNIRGIMVDGVSKEQLNDVKQEFLNHFQERFDKLVERRVTIDMSYPRSISCEQRDEL